MIKATAPRWFAAAALLLAVGSVSFAADTTAPATRPHADEQEAAINANIPSIVVVEYTLQYDKADAPISLGYLRRDPSGAPSRANGIEEFVSQERPYEKAGILIDKNTVLSGDPQINPRFIKSITIRRPLDDDKNNPPIAATISAYPKNQNTILLHTDAEIPGAVPAKFDPKKEGPYSVVTPSKENGQWAFSLKPLSEDLLLTAGKKVFSASPGLIVDPQGTPVAFSMGEELPIDGSWKVNPAELPAVSAKEEADTIQSLETSTSKNIVRVTLNFRSPKNLDQQTMYRQDNDANAAEQQALGILLDNKTVLILSDLKPNVTARLERIKVFTTPPIAAKFTASLSDYGAILATLEKPASDADPIHISKADIKTLRGKLLQCADIDLQGDKRVTHFQPARFIGLSTGWRKNLYVDYGGNDASLFLFDQDNALLAMPMHLRQKPGVDYGYNNIRTPITQITSALADLSKNTDPNNVPLSADQENRLAWLGFELQAMNKDLARANEVSDQTSDGESGALVTYVYPDSPAAKAGVESGWVLLRIETAESPKPIDVKIENDPFADHPFPWARLDQAPESIYDRIPTPWPRVENTLVRTVTDLGFGKTFTAVFFHDGKVDKKEFNIVQGPPYFQNAPKFKLAPLGLTVKDITYEVRRYMQKKTDEPGVVISKIEMGSKASSSGLKPYEIITHINDKPVMNVHDFETLTKGETELRLSVKRMTVGRIVKINLTPSADSQPATQDAPAAQ